MNLTEVDPSNFTARLDAAYRVYNKPRPARSIHASGYWNCGLQQYYSLVGESVTDETGEPEWEMSAEIGNAIHGIIQKRLAQSGMAVMLPSFNDNPNIRHLERVSGQLQPAIEVPLNDATLAPEYLELVKSHRFGGRVDAIVTTRDNGPAILEIKTISDKYLNPKTPDYISYYNDKLAHYQLQVMAYQHVFRMPDGSQITAGFIYVVNQANVKDVKMYKVSYDAPLMEQEFERIKKIKICVDAKTPPDPEPHRGPCKFCQWRSACPITGKEKSNGGYLFAK